MDKLTEYQNWLGRVRSGEMMLADAVDTLISLHLAVAGDIDTLKAFQADIKQELTDIMVETGQVSFHASAGSATVTKPGVIVDVDYKAMLAEAEEDPKLMAAIEKFIRRRERAGSLTIRGGKS